MNLIFDFPLGQKTCELREERTHSCKFWVKNGDSATRIAMYINDVLDVLDSFDETRTYK